MDGAACGLPAHGPYPEMTMADDPSKSASEPAPAPKKKAPQSKATGQRVSKERGAHTHHKKNPGKRPKQGGS